MAAAYDIPVVPHGSGPYSFQAIMTFPNSSFCEYIVCGNKTIVRCDTEYPLQANSPDGKSVHPSFGDLFLDEPLPVNGRVDLTDKPGFGMTLNPNAQLVPYSSFFSGPQKSLSDSAEDVKVAKSKVNGAHAEGNEAVGA
jgi:L-rhamnonate dehydratase